ncbi:uncharacterized protein Dwil_GK15236 [Drosophila willistoni]|uniref:VM domain-containing protein n=1 Tax=Drosophila willistoni TaxID=7260 RepID=B4MWD7_DROWI|nr:vitelline membrane protein Vm32E [Drosophila willistoni]EDW76007.1 uncharacterized protein Dwil_GK15236 [Drosophila willistoni]
MKIIGLLVTVFAGFAYASCNSYGSAKISSPPCPQSYLFSCQPNLSPAPCAQAPAAYPSSYGSAGAYTEQVPTYIGFAPQQHYQQQRYAQDLIEQLRGLHEFPGYE